MNSSSPIIAGSPKEEEADATLSHLHQIEQGTSGSDVLIVPDVVAVAVDVLETVTVLAPADLCAGYRLNVNDTDGQPLCVEVPTGGVRAGEYFPGIIVLPPSPNPQTGREQQHGHVPIGHWRDGIFDCFKFGVCNPLVCLGCFASSIVLGQQMTRNGLNACAEDLPDKNPTFSACRVMLFLFLVSLFSSIVCGEIIETTILDEEDGESTAQTGSVIGLRMARVGISSFYYVFVIIVAMRTRQFIRDKYKIRTGCCGRCEDFCCAVCCYQCMVCQLARHTIDYERYPAKCCTETGLPPDAPLPV